jgi:hypothetical protein
LPNWAYVNAVAAVYSAKDDPSRVRRLLAICLPMARGAPMVLFNASFAYAGIGDADACIEVLRKAKKRGVNLRKALSDPSLAGLVDDKRFVALRKATRA